MFGYHFSMQHSIVITKSRFLWLLFLIRQECDNTGEKKGGFSPPDHGCVIPFIASDKKLLDLIDTKQSEIRKKYGVDKIFIYDNNDITGEKIEDELKDYISKGFVEVLN